MTEIRINQNLCRLCGCKNENGQSLSGDQDDEGANELLLKVQETFSLLIGGNDPLPHTICIQCERDVNIFYMKIKRFRTLEKKWRGEVYKANPTHPYLNLQQYFDSEVNRLRETIDSTLAEIAQPDEMSMEQQMLQQQEAIDPLDTENLTKPAIEMIPINDVCDAAEQPMDPKELERIKERERRKKRKRFVGYVRSRKLKRKFRKAASAAEASTKKCINPASIDAMNTIPKMVLPYKKFRNAAFEIMSQNEILANRTRVNRRTLEPFDYKRATTPSVATPTPTPPLRKTQRHSLPNAVVPKDRCASSKTKSIKTPLVSSSGVDSSGDDNQLSPTCGSRNKRRINYSEELVDEAFMYEQILHDKQHQQKRKHSLTKSVESKSLDGVLDAVVNSAKPSGKIDSRLRLLEQRNEISITPVRSRLMAKDKQMDTLGGHRPIPIKTEPLFNITSSVSVHIKSRADQPVAGAAAAPTPAAQSIQISNITSLHGKSASPSQQPPSKKRRKISCDHCKRTFSDEKQFAIHQLEHMKISAYKIDAVRILNPKLRRGRMLNIDNKQFIRCVNCWLLHKNNKSILEHWNNGNCMFYCTVCGKSFHDSINDLQSHVEQEHCISQSSLNACRCASASTAAAAAPPAPSVPAPTKQAPMIKLQLKKELLNELMKPPESLKKSTVVELPSKSSGQKSTKSDALDDNFYCSLCNRKFLSRRSLSTHNTLIHKKKGMDARAMRPALSTMCPKSINPIAMLNEKIKSKSKNQKSTNKNWKLISSNEAVMRTVIRKVPQPSQKQPKQPKQPQKKHATKQAAAAPKKKHLKSISEPIPTTNQSETEISQDQTVSSTYLSAQTVAQPDNDDEYDDSVDGNGDDDNDDDDGVVNNDVDLDIKPEPIEEYSNSYIELPTQSTYNNSWVQLPPQQYDEWNYGNGTPIGMDNGSILDAYLDTSPRLKVKDLNDLQHPPRRVQSQPQQQQQQQRYPMEFQGYVPADQMYKDQPVIMTNQNSMSGFQIQNVQSYQVPQQLQSQSQPPPPPPPQIQSQSQVQLQPPPPPPVLQQQPPPPNQVQSTMLQPPPLQPIPVQHQNHYHHPQQASMPPQSQPQPYTNYSYVNTTNLAPPSQGLCQPGNLYEMHHMTQAQPIQNTQLINPVYMFPTPPTSTHTVPDYHY